MATETLLANGDGDDAIRVGIAELEFHANMGGSHYAENTRRDTRRPLSRYGGELAIRSEFPPKGYWRRL